jgi:hypothetical protein
MLKSSRTISDVSVALKPNFSETSYISIIRVRPGGDLNMDSSDHLRRFRYI